MQTLGHGDVQVIYWPKTMFIFFEMVRWFSDISCRSTPEPAPRLFLQILAHSAGVVASKWSEWEQSSWKQPRWMPKAPKFTNKPRPCNDLERLRPNILEFPWGILQHRWSSVFKWRIRWKRKKGQACSNEIRFEGTTSEEAWRNRKFI